MGEGNKLLKITVRSLIVFYSCAILLIACKKSGEDDAPPPPPPPPPVVVNPYGNCSACFSSSSALLTGVNTQSGSGELVGIFDIVAGSSPVGFNLTDAKAILYYSGTFQVIGTMTVAASTSFRMCGVPPGQYIVRPTNNGWISLGAISYGGTVIGESSAGRFTAQILGGVITNGTSASGVVRGDPGNRLSMTFRFESVNGQPCAIIYSPGIEFF